MAQLTHAEWFFKHQEQAGAPLSHLTFRCSTYGEPQQPHHVVSHLLHVSQLTESGRFRLLDVPLWLLSWASSSLERSSPLQSCASPGEWLESFAVPFGLAACWWVVLASMMMNANAIGGVQVRKSYTEGSTLAAPPARSSSLPQIS